MILGDRVNRVEAQMKEGRGKFEGMNVNINIGNAREENGRLEFDYVCKMEYKPEGNITIEGTVVAEEDKKETKRILDAWKKDKAIPKDYMEKLLNVVNFLTTAHGTIIARVLNMRPPIKTPRLSLKESESA